MNGKATIVNIAPVPIMADKPGLFPGRFFIPAGDEDDPQILIIGDSYHLVYLGAESAAKYVRVPDSADVVANAIVEDFKRGIICREEGSEPGVFWLPRVIKDIAKECNGELAVAKQVQRQWFRRLIDMADNDWNQTNSPRCISDLQRRIATKLKLDKPWMHNVEAVNAIQCPACFTNLNPRAIVCANCKLVIKPDEYKKMTFANFEGLEL